MADERKDHRFEEFERALTEAAEVIIPGVAPARALSITEVLGTRGWYNQRRHGVERPLQVLHGPITENVEDMLSVTLSAGPFYYVDEEGNVRDGEGEIVCQLVIWRMLPRSWAQAEATRALAVIKELTTRLQRAAGEAEYPGWLAAEVARASEELQNIIGDYQP